VFVMVSELLERAEERRDRTEKDGFGEMQLFRLNGSTDMRLESRVRVGDRSG